MIYLISHGFLWHGAVKLFPIKEGEVFQVSCVNAQVLILAAVHIALHPGYALAACLLCAPISPMAAPAPSGTASL